MADQATAAGVKADLFAILDAVPGGYGSLRLAIMEGRIDPMYPNVSPTFRRGCIKAHLAAHLGVDSWNAPGVARYIIDWQGGQNPCSPVERYIASVRYTQKPATCPILKELVGMLDEWLERRNHVDDGEDVTDVPAPISTEEDF